MEVGAHCLSVNVAWRFVQCATNLSGSAETPGLLQPLESACRNSGDVKQMDALFHYFIQCTRLVGKRMEEVFTKADYSQR